MALYTKKLIMTTFQEMLAEMPFDRITVSALVKRAGGSPNTFYYHHQDIYVLLDDWFQKQVDAPCSGGRAHRVEAGYEEHSARMSGPLQNHLSCV